MRHATIALLIALLLPGCARTPERAKGEKLPADMNTIESAEVQPAPIEPPPALTEENPPPKAKSRVLQPDQPPPPTPRDDSVRAALPFAPAIAMDPVDGSKISIRADTLKIDLKNRVYYFRNEENRKQFLANPEQYQKGLFSRL